MSDDKPISFNNSKGFDDDGGFSRPATSELAPVSLLAAEQVRAAIDAEEELPEEMPDYVYVRIRLSKKAAEELMRAAVRATKQGIKARLGL